MFGFVCFLLTIYMDDQINFICFCCNITLDIVILLIEVYLYQNTVLYHQQAQSNCWRLKWKKNILCFERCIVFGRGELTKMNQNVHVHLVGST